MTNNKRVYEITNIKIIIFMFFFNLLTSNNVFTKKGFIMEKLKYHNYHFLKNYI